MANLDSQARAQQLCSAARKLPPADRVAFLEAACGDDQDPASAVESLLGGTVTFAYEESAEAGKRDLSTVVADPNCCNRLPGAHTAAAFTPPALPGYELLEEYGRGAMGVVLKSRIGLNRLVAQKVVLLGQLASDEAIRRFRTETQAANLDHTGIVPVYEVNSHAGWHYYSMGLVKDRR